MNSRHAFFAQCVNRVAEAWIEPEIEAARQELIDKGQLDSKKIDELLLKIKTELQAQYIPIARKELEDKMNNLQVERMRPKK